MGSAVPWRYWRALKGNLLMDIWRDPSAQCLPAIPQSAQDHVSGQARSSWLRGWCRAALKRGVGEQRGTTERCTVISQGPEGRESNRAWKRLCSQSVMQPQSHSHSVTHIQTHTLILSLTPTHSDSHTLTHIYTHSHLGSHSQSHSFSNIYMHSRHLQLISPEHHVSPAASFSCF